METRSDNLWMCADVRKDGDTGNAFPHQKEQIGMVGGMCVLGSGCTARGPPGSSVGWAGTRTEGGHVTDD